MTEASNLITVLCYKVIRNYYLRLVVVDSNGRHSRCYLVLIAIIEFYTELVIASVNRRGILHCGNQIGIAHV